jgi:transcription elongation GreA/GreB family factor
MELKEELYKLCEEYIDKRIQSSRTAIDEAQMSANEETKSSSGDKYETGRAMAQLEIEKNSQQLKESLKLRSALDQIRIDVVAPAVQPGSLVVTDRGIFFVAISLGKISHRGKTYFVIAPASPLGLKLSGAKVGDIVEFRQEAYVIKELI